MTNRIFHIAKQRRALCQLNSFGNKKIRSTAHIGEPFISEITVFFESLFESPREENRPHPGNRTERKEAGLLGPTKSGLGSNLAVLGLKLGRTRWFLQAPIPQTWGLSERKHRRTKKSDHCATTLANGGHVLCRYNKPRPSRRRSGA